MTENLSYQQMEETISATHWGEVFLQQVAVEETIEDLTQKCIDYFVEIAAERKNISALHFKDYVLVTPNSIEKYFEPLLEIGIAAETIRNYVIKDVEPTPHYIF